ncbi:MAG: hypothetical protein RBR91_04255 [Porticoccaceae bacterium]|jgi:hypothetical protein|nr:hypothetical protein [Porticoccaceae bacterium]
MDTQPPNQDQLIARLSLPANPVPSLSCCGASGEDVARFLDDLPRANQAELLNRLYQAMPEVAALDRDPATKIDILNLFAPVVLKASEALVAKSSVNAKTTKQVSLALALIRNLALGYKAVVVAAARTTPLPAQLLASAIQAAIATLGKLLTTCWQGFLNPPANLWREIHALYLLARTLGIDNLTPFSAQSVSNQALSPRAAYLRILLAAAADPARFTPADLKRILAFLETHAHHASLVGADEPALFTIDPDSDMGPIQSARIDNPRPRHLRLRSSDLVDYIDRYTRVTDLDLPPRLVALVRRHWADEVARGEEHRPDDSPVTVVFGLNRIHRLLTQTLNIDDYVNKAQILAFNAARRLRDDESIPVKTWFDTQEIDRPQAGHWLRAAQANPEDPIQFESRKEKSGEEAIRPVAATRLNTSNKGACIELPDAGDAPSPGELVAIQDKGGAPWRVGLVRWTRTTPSLTRLLGVEFLGRGLVPCAAAMMKDGHPSTAFFPALILQGGDQSREILLPAMPFVEHSLVSVLTPKSRVTAHLGEIREATFHVNRFRLDNPPPQPSLGLQPR